MASVKSSINLDDILSSNRSKDYKFFMDNDVDGLLYLVDDKKSVNVYYMHKFVTQYNANRDSAYMCDYNALLRQYTDLNYQLSTSDSDFYFTPNRGDSENSWHRDVPAHFENFCHNLADSINSRIPYKACYEEYKNKYRDTEMTFVDQTDMDFDGNDNDPFFSLRELVATVEQHTVDTPQELKTVSEVNPPFLPAESAAAVEQHTVDTPQEPKYDGKWLEFSDSDKFKFDIDRNVFEFGSNMDIEKFGAFLDAYNNMYHADDVENAKAIQLNEDDQTVTTEEPTKMERLKNISQNGLYDIYKYYASVHDTAVALKERGIDKEQLVSDLQKVVQNVYDNNVASAANEQNYDFE